MPINLNKWTLTKEKQYKVLKEERDNYLKKAVSQLREFIPIEIPEAEYLLLNNANEIIKILESFKR